MLDNYHRCKDCIRPVCQKIITLNGCKQKNIEQVEGEPLNGYFMPEP